MSYGYGGRANPYAQQDSPAGQYGSPAGQYGSPQQQPQMTPQTGFDQSPRPGGGGYSQYDNGAYDGAYGNNVEMAPLSQNGASFAASDPNAILNECRDIGQGIDGIETNLNQLRMLQDRSLNETDSSSSGTSRELDNLSAETMSMYRELTDRIRKMKSTPDAKTPKNAPQVGRIDRRLKNAIQQYQEVEANFRKRMNEQMVRQYRIVKPDALEEDVEEAVAAMAAGGSQQVFQQAMLNSNRQGQARAVLNAVKDRQEKLERIERDMIELAQLFQDMDTLIVQQEAAVVQIEQKGEEVVENLDKGNQEIEVAVDTARKTRRKKWYCVGISVLIVVVIVIIVVVYMAVTGKFSSNNNNNGNANAKRSAVEFDGERPVTTIYAQSKIVNIGQDYDATSAPLEKFSGATSGKSIAGRLAVPDHRRRSDMTLPVPSIDSTDYKRADYNEVD